MPDGVEGYRRSADGSIICPRSRDEDTLCVAVSGDSAISLFGVCVSCDESPADLLRQLVAAVTTPRERTP